MKVTKFVHSCLLVETSDLTALIDYGNYSFESRLLDIRKMAELGYIIFTHEHPDHYHEPALRQISQRFPDAKVVTNNDQSAKIKQLDLPNPIQTHDDKNLAIFSAKHEPLPLDLPNVTNIGVHVGGRLTHSGDSYELNETKDFLALPVTAPFASFREALAAVIKLKPRAVLPLHDWEWQNDARVSRYKWAKDLLKPHGIDFIGLENGESVEL